MPSPLASAEPWSLVSAGYTQFTQPFLAQYSEVALESLELATDDVVVDVAAGPGTTSLLMAPHVREVHAIDFSPAMLDQLRQAIARAGFDNVHPKLMNGQQLEYGSEMFDGYISMFGLMFFPDFERGLSEALRVLKPGGKFCFSSWAPAADSELMALLYDTLEHASDTFKRETPDPDSLMFEPAIRRRLEQAGMARIEIESCKRTLPERPNAARDFWLGAVEGSVPLVLMRSKMPAEAWAQVEEKAIAYLASRLRPDLELGSVAWIATARKPS